MIIIPPKVKLVCAYCQIDFERDMGYVFCKPSHKVNFHRRGMNLLKVVKDVNKTQLKEGLSKTELPIAFRRAVKEIKQCEHGYMVGLCKHGCKK